MSDVVSDKPYQFVPPYHGRWWAKFFQACLPRYLDRAWGIMYGDEAPITVRLRFSKYVAERVHETRWHASQRIVDLPDGGCEWEAKIGDITEIGYWVRGWGRDCEVLEPDELRTTVMMHVEQLAHMYELKSGAANEADLSIVTAEDEALIDEIFG